MRSNCRGFSLLEVLIAFVLIGVSAMGLLRLQAAVERQADYARLSRVALSLAEQQLTQLRTRGASASLSQWPVTSFAAITNLVDTSHPPYKLTLQVSQPIPSLSSAIKQIDLSVSWPNRAGTMEQIQLQTVVSKYSEFDP
ncbi:type IV pilus modification PilV family protein [Vibrio sp.]|uniref:type IV pilus modification PilV family protein n=1 Tax=Vibrio sp. TaxID=678 RepID=UPI003D14B78F